MVMVRLYYINYNILLSVFRFLPSTSDSYLREESNDFMIYIFGWLIGPQNCKSLDLGLELILQVYNKSSKTQHYDHFNHGH